MEPKLRRRFSRSQRLLCGSDYRFVFDKPWRSSSSAVTVLARQRDNTNARLGLVISKKCAKSAVKRNRLKRLIRESFRYNQVRLCGWDIVVIGRRELTTKTNGEIVSELNKHWNRLARCNQSS